MATEVVRPQNAIAFGGVNPILCVSNLAVSKDCDTHAPGFKVGTSAASRGRLMDHPMHGVNEE